MDRFESGAWRDLLRRVPASLLVEYETGSEWAPDDPWGFCVLALRGDGGLALDNRAMGTHRR